MIYVLSYENDGDFHECEIILATTSHKNALEKAKLRPKTYALSIIRTWENDKYIDFELFDSDSKYPDTSKMQ